eukprot:TRINITY_DN16152_c0_g2_i2.p1 TRINITY_DN16152_c0_g2~~TRINITY_DN16152_c0_g2_i2.p1  ORF type:complete len:515 (-),score=88.03 TRINITY_DN16152_c0_g2_i2:60-1469(-)
MVARQGQQEHQTPDSLEDLSALQVQAKVIPTFASKRAKQAWSYWGKSVGSNISMRSHYMEGKLEMEQMVIGVLDERHPSWEAPPAAETIKDRKIAFLFMLMRTLSWEKVWAKFFARQQKSKYSIYVHRASVQNDSATDSPLALRRFGSQLVPWVNSTWCALVGVEVAMLRASLLDPNNAQFVFISQDSVPLRSFEYVYDGLIGRSAETSKFCFAEPARHKYAALEQISNQLGTRCCFRDFYSPINSRVKKHHQWIVLARSHAATIAARALEGLHRWADVWKVAAPDIARMGEGCSDESVPFTTLFLEDEETRDADGSAVEEAEISISDRMQLMGIEENCLTFVNWYNCFRKSEFQLAGAGLKAVHERGKDLWRYLFDRNFDFVHETKMNGFPTVYDRIDMDYLARLTQAGFMFGRKFPQNVTLTRHGYTTNESFADFLPTLWTPAADLRATDEESGSKVWKRLQTEFHP